MSATALMTLVNTTKFVYPFVWKNQKIEVELSSGIELIFDINGNFVRLDD